jgi:hypothetical protein
LNGALDLVKVLASGESVSVATLGMEAFVGHALGTDHMPAQVLCEIRPRAPGYGWICFVSMRCLAEFRHS